MKTANALPLLNHSPMLPAVADSVSAYVSTVRAIPLLSAEEEQELARRCFFHKDKEAARALCLANLRLVVSLAHKYDGYGLDRADLIQAGNIGLLSAVRRFDPQRGVRFATFAVYWIRSEMHEFIIANWRIVKIATTKAQRKLFFNMRKLFNSQHEHFNAEAVASELEVDVDTVQDMRARITNTAHTSDAVSFANDDDGDGESASKTEHYIADTSDDSQDPEVLLETQAKQAVMQAAFDSLNDREQAIISARRLSEPAQTLQTLSDQHQISIERVRQIEAAALKKMTAHVAKHWTA